MGRIEGEVLYYTRRCEIDHQHVMCRREKWRGVVHGTHSAVRECLGVETGRGFGVLVVPNANSVRPGIGDYFLTKKTAAVGQP